MKTTRRLLTLALIVALAYGGWTLAHGSVARLQSIDIVLDPNSRESFMFEKIQSSLTANLARFSGLPFWRISLDDVMNEVRNDRRVRTARIQREFPHHLRVYVAPQEPMLGYMDEKGHVFPVARDSTLMPALSLKDVPNFPLLRGKEFQSNEILRERAIRLIETLHVDGRFSRDMVSEILHSEKDGFDIYLTNQLAEIKMGEDEFELKAARVEKVLSYLHNRGLKGRVIDARFARKVVVRMHETHKQN